KKKGDSFMGSDLSYEDMTSRELDENEFVRLDDDEVDGKECYMLEVTPKPEAKSNYSKHMTWVEKATLLAVKEESYDQNGNLKKTKVFNTSRMGDYNIMTGIFVKDVQKEHTTRVTFDEIQLDTGLEESLFQEKNLKRMPR
ncbi:MAG: outer membrane lipoprotein-sorting protein, partial [Candidatus Marinimicrobia bacterium]|nr:outer membrane lipoprotein-sorting protein [Candidatus Neomarinimicrobiota bacterium]